MNDGLTVKQWAERYDGLRQRYDSLVEAVQGLEKKNTELENKNEYHEQQLKNADLNVHQQKATLINTMTLTNEVQQEMAKEIALLKAEIKELKNGDND